MRPSGHTRDKCPGLHQSWPDLHCGPRNSWGLFPACTRWPGTFLYREEGGREGLSEGIQAPICHHGPFLKHKIQSNSIKNYVNARKNTKLLFFLNRLHIQVPGLGLKAGLYLVPGDGNPNPLTPGHVAGIPPATPQRVRPSL